MKSTPQPTTAEMLMAIRNERPATLGKVSGLPEVRATQRTNTKSGTAIAANHKIRADQPVRGFLQKSLRVASLIRVQAFRISPRQSLRGRGNGFGRSITVGAEGSSSRTSSRRCSRAALISSAGGRAVWLATTVDRSSLVDRFRTRINAQTAARPAQACGQGQSSLASKERWGSDTERGASAAARAA